MSVEIRSAEPNERHEVAAAIVAAFITDPLARFAFPSPLAFLRGMPRIAQAFASRSLEHGSAYATADFCGAALWYQPGLEPDGGALEQVFRDEAKPEHLDDLLATLEAMARWHPADAHWYLSLIGVEPKAQGEGLGHALMRHALARCDREQQVAYLESTNPRNIALYVRHGFEVLARVQVGAGPIVTPMVRFPR